MASPVGSAGHPEVVEDVEVEVSPVDVEDVDVASVVTVVEVCSVVVASVVTAVDVCSVVVAPVVTTVDVAPVDVEVVCSFGQTSSSKWSNLPWKTGIEKM